MTVSFITVYREVHYKYRVPDSSVRFDIETQNTVLDAANLPPKVDIAGSRVRLYRAQNEVP